jgi:hypothetical protein
MRKLPDTYRVIYQAPAGDRTATRTMPRDEALMRFAAGVRAIEASAGQRPGERYYVQSDAEWRRSEAARAAQTAGAR